MMDRSSFRQDTEFVRDSVDDVGVLRGDVFGKRREREGEKIPGLRSSCSSVWNVHKCFLSFHVELARYGDEPTYHVYDNLLAHNPSHRVANGRPTES